MPSATSDLERQLKLVTKTGKFIVGRKEVAGSLKGSKLLVWSSSANLPMDLIEQCRNLQIPAVRFDGNPIDLGRLAGIPYKVSVLSVRSPGDADLQSLSNSQDYSTKQGTGIVFPSAVNSAKSSAVVTETLEKSTETKLKSKRAGRKEKEESGEIKETKKRTKAKKVEEGVSKKGKARSKPSEKGEKKKSKSSPVSSKRQRKKSTDEEKDKETEE